MNKAFFIGNLTRDPEMKTTGTGKAMCKFDVAVNRKYKDKNGDYQSETTYFPVIVWDKLAEICGKILTKGFRVACEAKFRVETYDDKEGVKRKSFQFVSSEVHFLSTKGESKPAIENSFKLTEEPGNAAPADPWAKESEEEIPF